MVTPGKYKIYDTKVTVSNCSPELLALIKEHTHTDDVSLSNVLNFTEIERLLVENNITSRAQAVERNMTYTEICKIAGVQFDKGASNSLSRRAGKIENSINRAYDDGRHACYYVPLGK